MKAHFEWNLRRATEDDAKAMSALEGDLDALTLSLMLGSTRAFVIERKGVVGWGMVREIAPPFESDASIPAGWYLTGLVVHPDMRRQGMGRALTKARLDWLKGKTKVVRYFTSHENIASIALHRSFGFIEKRKRLCGDSLQFGSGPCVLFEKNI